MVSIKDIGKDNVPEDKKYIIIVVDMDDDIGRKANIRTPILGREDNINAAVRLGLTDPGDSDLNSILGGVQHYDYLKKEGKDVEIATVSGDIDVESEVCAIRIKEQLDFLIYLYEPDFIYLVSDGKEDELVLKYLELKDVFVWKKRIVIKQNESLESTYYLMQEFIKKTMSQYIPLIFTSIGFAMILYALFSDLGWRIISGLIGIYILSEGVGLVESIKKMLKESRKGLELGKLSPFGNILGYLIVIVGILYSYKVSEDPELAIFFGKFLFNLANPLTLGFLVLVTVNFIDDLIHTEKSILSLLKKLFFNVILAFMLRQMFLISSEYLTGVAFEFTTLAMYIIAYISILIILSVVLFHGPKKSKISQKTEE
ncbi:Protein of unknown function DUF373 [Methanococcus vannielii SB]|jgi:putative membrane protein|uniref:DUF373 family protein n=1 Tax=Methanococcus vannielii (strain ATCC 35089 / DSM 1224 / JCM 13029 / OCM 148 / SB) TaxID=406327 RepID=A6UPB9_METVS|nr:DUF373 family protein [Methanococcus vannielii]ABR54341.1 Protein of unknown function DUF373 [Methanococcus vannielii SB]